MLHEKDIPANVATAERVRTAAKLRIEHPEMTWQQISDMLGIPNSTVTHWPQQYPQYYRQACIDALDALILDAENEAMHEVRKQTKELSNSAGRRAASQIVLQHGREIRGTKQRIEAQQAVSGIVRYELVVVQQPPAVAEGSSAPALPIPTAAIEAPQGSDDAAEAPEIPEPEEIIEDAPSEGNSAEGA